MPRPITALCLAALCTANPTIAGEEHHGDIVIGLDADGRLRTGVEHADGDTEWGVRVAEARLDEDVFPNLTEDPGFDSELGAFVPGTQIGFNIIDGLRSWDGSAFAQIDPVYRLSVTADAAVATTRFDGLPEPGFVFGSADGSGVFHNHLRFFLDPYDVLTQIEGLWLLSCELWSPTALTSEPIYIVFAAGETNAAMQDDAIAWVEQALIGDPACGIADLAEPVGTLDLADITAFVSGFVAQDVIADLDGSGLFDLADITLFVGFFTDGCG